MGVSKVVVRVVKVEEIVDDFVVPSVLLAIVVNVAGKLFRVVFDVVGVVEVVRVDA